MLKYLILLFIPILLIGQVQDAQKEFHYDVDYSRFKASDGWVYVEIYFSIPRNILEHKEERNGYSAEYEIQVKISNEDSIVSSKSWKRTDTVDSLSMITRGQRLYDIYSVYLKAGNYNLRVNVKDIYQNISRWYDNSITIVQFPDTKLSVSDVELAINLVPSNEKNSFTKNGYKIIPNPAAVYDTKWSKIYYYCEIYNLSPRLPQHDSTYSVHLLLKDQQGSFIKDIRKKTHIRKAKALVDVGHFDVSNLLSGGYQLHLIVKDHGTNDSIAIQKNFIFYRAADFAVVGAVKTKKDPEAYNEYQGMSEQEIDDQFEKARYIATNNEKDVYEDLDLVGKREFMAGFWLRRDDSPKTPVIEYKQNYFKRIEQANQHYTMGEKEGWRTDRGRILLSYGKPDDIERISGGTGSIPYQKWIYYYIEGGIEFVFVDARGFGDYRLVHSTSVNELQDYEWQQRWLQQKNRNFFD